ncbi:sulfurtransferase [Corynebacterium sp. HS2168-gen11]|uniref:sulfurtransferase n=1 Tax=Corynebacterium sp. HS2168-gen11 TaxID=2974027 RepID=UPI00216B5D8A|nr:sulfurtransferase [Corynebacterium sp. HS2168-gen11]MCS4536022.1 sulfurtransferase [Corynebacterium sp. HS2168-gen11]
MSITMNVTELADRIHAGRPPLILASLWSAREGGGYALYNSAHIPDAFFCDTEFALSSVSMVHKGRNPLPTKAILDKWFLKWGLTTDREVVVYDNFKGLFAARAWWILTWAGVKNVRILDGGQAKWEASGYKLIGGPGNPRVIQGGESQLGHLPVATLADVKAHQGILIDCRERNRFAGRKERLDLKAGHIPGAKNIATRLVLEDDYTFRSPEQLRELFTSMGVTPETIDDVIVYSGSGNHSAQVIAAMVRAGLPVPRHFVGGWSQWCADSRNPVETGD